MIEMAHTGGVCSSFVHEMMAGVHDLTSDTLKCALFAYDNDINPTNAFSAATTAYATANECSGAGYTAGGITVTGTRVPIGNGWGFRLVDIEFPACTVSATQALIYNASKENRAVAWMRFGSIQSSVANPFKIRWDFARPPLIRFEV